MRKWVYGIVGLLMWLVIFFVVPALYEFNPLAQYDLHRYCAFVSGYPFAPDGDVTRNAEDAYAMMSFPLYSQAARNIRLSIAFANPPNKWELYQQGAREVGIENYDCPALREYLQRTVY